MHTEPDCRIRFTIPYKIPDRQGRVIGALYIFLDTKISWQRRDTTWSLVRNSESGHVCQVGLPDCHSSLQVEPNRKTDKTCDLSSLGGLVCPGLESCLGSEAHPQMCFLTVPREDLSQRKPNMPPWWYPFETTCHMFFKQSPSTVASFRPLWLSNLVDNVHATLL